MAPDRQINELIIYSCVVLSYVSFDIIYRYTSFLSEAALINQGRIKLRPNQLRPHLFKAGFS